MDKEEFHKVLKQEISKLQDINYNLENHKLRTEVYSLEAELREAKEENEKLRQFKENIVSSKNDFIPDMSMYEYEKRLVLNAMKYYEGNKTQAANSLGITIKSLYNKLHEYGEFERYAR